jgi:anti-anti-sigma regulatory factor
VDTATKAAQAAGAELMVTGALDAWTTVEVYQMLQDALGEQPSHLTINLAACEAIDTAGILLLLDTHRRAGLVGCVVTLRSPSSAVFFELRRAQVDKVIQIEAGA